MAAAEVRGSGAREHAAAEAVQRAWAVFASRVHRTKWDKIVADNGDVFYRHRVSGELVWNIPERVGRTRVGVTASGRAGRS
jgi:hypothetical protein